MNIPNLASGILGIFLVYLSIKSFIFYGKGGAFGMDINKSIFTPGSFVNKPNGEKSEKVLLLRNAVVFLLVGLALCYESFLSIIT